MASVVVYYQSKYIPWGHCGHRWLQLTPNVPGGQGVSQCAPCQPRAQTHFPVSGRHDAELAQAHDAEQLAPNEPRLQRVSQLAPVKIIQNKNWGSYDVVLRMSG